MVKQAPDNFPRSISQYTPNMEFAADVIGETVIVNLGAPAALNADGILDGVSTTTAANTITSSSFASTFDGSSTSLTTTAGQIDATYGRSLTCIAITGVTSAITVTGRDYLGQIMQETMTLGGTTTVAGLKAFKYVDTCAVAAGGPTGGTFDLGWGDLLGLPYKAEILLSDTEDKVAAAGSITAGVATDPQTATTGDPRGTFSPASATDGSIVYEVRYIVDNTDLHGVEQFTS
jgi:hypothetical protein